MKKLLLAVLFLAVPLSAAPAPHHLLTATQQKIEALLRHPALQSAHVGLAIVALGTAKSPVQFPAASYDDHSQPLLFGRDEQKRFVPASNFKLFTALWALHQLGPQKTFTTRAVRTQILAAKAGSWPTATPYPGVVTLYGDGDPSLSSDDLQMLAGDVRAKDGGALIVRASDALFEGGNMNGEEGGGRYPDGWTLDDALWYYGAPVSALALNRNQVDVTVVGGEKVGDPATIFYGTEKQWIAYQNTLATAGATPPALPELPFPVFAPVLTVASTDPRAGKLTWTRGDGNSPLGQTLTIAGFMAPGQVDAEGVAVPDPRDWAQTVFATKLRDKGAQVVEPTGFYGQKDPAIIAQHTSPPLSQLLQQFLKTSDNLYGEMLLRRAAVELPMGKAPVALPKGVQISSTGLAARAHQSMAIWLSQSGVPLAGTRFSDGCGLSRYDLTTPLTITRLLALAQKVEAGKTFYDALPIAGVDGTLKKRMVGSAAQNNVRAKTGTFSIVNCLSGYVTTRDGQRLAVSILTNGVEDGEVARNWEGRVFATLADADFGVK